MKSSRDNVLIAVFGALFLLSVFMMVSQQGVRTTGHATTSTTVSNVTISIFFAVDMSTNLSDGIRFGNITALPTIDQNASHNYDGVNTTISNTTAGNTLPGTSMWMNVSTDSNSRVDFCIQATDNLKTSAGDVLLVANETYYNSTLTNYTLPAPGSAIAITTAYASAGRNISQGSNNYYRFWLDVPAATASGTYNNTINFKGVTYGGSC